MAPIERTDSVLLPLPPSRVFPILSDFSGYPKWWPQQVRFQVSGPSTTAVGTRIRISNGPLVKWTATVREVVQDRSIRFEYSEGAWEGEAQWLVEAKSSGCEVSYKIFIRPAQGWLKVLSKVLDLGELHSKEMAKVLSNLKATF